MARGRRIPGGRSGMERRETDIGGGTPRPGHSDSSSRSGANHLPRFRTNSVNKVNAGGSPVAAKTPGQAASTERLMKYWTSGEGALKIQWGKPGDFDRCKKLLGPKVPASVDLDGL